MSTSPTTSTSSWPFHFVMPLSAWPVFLWILPTLFSSLPSRVGSFIDFPISVLVLRFTSRDLLLTATLVLDFILVSAVEIALKGTYQVSIGAVCSRALTGNRRQIFVHAAWRTAALKDSVPSCRSRSAASWHWIQRAAHGMAARRFGLIADSHSMHVPNSPP